MTSENIFKFVTYGSSVLFVAALIIFVYVCSLPRYTDGTFQFASGEGFRFTAPALYQIWLKQPAVVDFAIILAPVHVTKFKCYGLTAATQFRVGNLSSSKGGADAQTLDFSDVLHVGSNPLHVEFKASNLWLSFYLRPDISDPWILLLLGLSGFALFLGSKTLMRLFPKCQVGRVEASLFWFGAMLRLIYCLSTAYFIRTYDVEQGHLRYIDVLSSTWRLPESVAQSLEFFQPPVYYLLCALSTQLPKALGVPRSSLVEIWQLESCVIAIVTLAVCLWVSHLLFEREGLNRQLFFLFITVFPTFIYAANGINNDILFGLISVLWLALLLNCWRRLSLSKWLCLSFVLAVGMLVKANTIPLIGASIILLMLTRQVSSLSKFLLASIMSTIILLGAGWYYIPKATPGKNAAGSVVGNLETIDKSLFIKEDGNKLATFNPAAVVAYPFSSQSSLDPRREYFCEYLFRSAFFGENFFFPGDSRTMLARIIVCLALLLLPTAVVGWFRTVGLHFKGPALPLTILAITVCGAHLAFVLQAPFICCQHFRYSSILFFSLTYFCLRGLSLLPARLKNAGYVVFCLLIVFCFLFVTSLVVG